MTKKEINELKCIIAEYAGIDDKMRTNEELLKKISAEQTELMNRLEKNELREKSFMDEMSTKYNNLTITDLLKYI